jgi:hypothetical protein
MYKTIYLDAPNNSKTVNGLEFIVIQDCPTIEATVQKISSH